MKTTYLLPSIFKRIGWIIFIPAALFGLTYIIFDPDIKLVTNVFAIWNSNIGLLTDSAPEFLTVVKNNILDEIITIFIILSLIFIAFSREKFEDEFIGQLRLKALVWATYVNYGILLLAVIFVYNISFYWVLVFNLFTILIVFIISFRWMLYKAQKDIRYEK